MVELKRIYWSRQALRLAYSAVMLWLAASVMLALMPNATITANQGAKSVPDIFRGMLEAVVAAATLPLVFAGVLSIVAVVLRTRDVRRRDPVRRFTRQQRREGMARAAGQCEMETGFGRRCARPAEHGDHFYPWSKGGSTSLQNFVAACARCNRSKGARIPSPGHQNRLQQRRRTYVEFEDAVAVGERQLLP